MQIVFPPREHQEIGIIAKMFVPVNGHDRRNHVVERRFVGLGAKGGGFCRRPQCFDGSPTRARVEEAVEASPLVVFDEREIVDDFGLPFAQGICDEVVD